MRSGGDKARFSQDSFLIYGSGVLLKLSLRCFRASNPSSTHIVRSAGDFMLIMMAFFACQTSGRVLFMPRLIKPEDIPRTLWQPDQNKIHLAPDLVDAWKELLNHGGLFEKAVQPAPEGVIGGVSKSDTDDHLAWRFTGSSARVQLGLLDPYDKLKNVSDAFARVFSGGTVLVTDLPCGSGAAIITILATVAELRRTGRLPRMPLNVKVVGGEISEFARYYASRALEGLHAKLADQAIWVTAEFVHWDTLDKFSTADLNNKLTLVGQECSARLLILANFSGFLQGDGKWKKAQPQFDSLFIHCRNIDSFAIWIEPQKNSVIANGGFFERVGKWFKTLFAPYGTNEQEIFDPSELSKSSAKVQHPLRDDHQFDVNLVVKRFDLPLKVMA